MSGTRGEAHLSRAPHTNIMMYMTTIVTKAARGIISIVSSSLSSAPTQLLAFLHAGYVNHRATLLARGRVAQLDATAGGIALCDAHWGHHIKCITNIKNPMAAIVAPICPIISCLRLWFEGMTGSCVQCGHGGC